MCANLLLLFLLFFCLFVVIFLFKIWLYDAIKIKRESIFFLLSMIILLFRKMNKLKLKNAL